MQKILFYTLFTVIAYSSAAQVNTNATAGLLFNGIYQSDSTRIDNIDNAHHWYLRFYENGAVVLKETFVEPEVLIKKFIPGNKYANTGTYKLNGNNLSAVFDMGKDLLGNPWSLEGNGYILSNGKIQLQIKTIATDYHTPPYNSTFTFIKISVQ